MTGIQPWSWLTPIRENDHSPCLVSAILIFLHTFNPGLFIDSGMIVCYPCYMLVIFTTCQKCPYRSYIEFGLSPAPQSKQVSAVQFSSLAWDKTLECVYRIIYGPCTKPCIGSSSPPEFYSQTPDCLMLKPIFAGRDSNISSYLYGINRSIHGRYIL